MESQPVLVPLPGFPPRPGHQSQQQQHQYFVLHRLQQEQQQQQQQQPRTAAVNIPQRHSIAGSRRAPKRVQFADDSPSDYDDLVSSASGSAPKRLCSFLEESVNQANVRLSRISCSEPADDADASCSLRGTAAAIQTQVRLLSCASDEAAVVAAISELSRLFQMVPAARQEQLASTSGGIRALILSTSSRSGNSCCRATSVQLAAAQALTKLAAASSALQAAIIAAGGVRLLVELLGRGSRAASLGAVEVAEAAAAGLVAMTMCGHPGGVAAIVAAGGVKALVQAAAGSHSGLRLEAVRALCNVSAGPTQHRSAIADASGIPLLVELLHNGNREVQYAAVNTLDSLAVYSPAHKRAMTEAGTVKAVVQLLRRISSSSSAGASMGGGGDGLAAALQEACAGLLETLVTRYPANLLAIEAAGGIRLLQQLVRSCIAAASSGASGSIGSSIGSVVVADDAAEGVKEAAISALKKMNAVIPLR